MYLYKFRGMYSVVFKQLSCMMAISECCTSFNKGVLEAIAQQVDSDKRMVSGPARKILTRMLLIYKNTVPVDTVLDLMEGSAAYCILLFFLDVKNVFCQLEEPGVTRYITLIVILNSCLHFQIPRTFSHIRERLLITPVPIFLSGY